MTDPHPRAALLAKVVAYAEHGGIAGKSLREIASGVGTSHRMLLYHFGSREGLLAAIVSVVEARQRAAMTSMTAEAGTPRELMTRLWEQVSGAEIRPFVRLFFEVFGLAAQRVPGTEALLASLTTPWLDDGAAAASQLGVRADPTATRLGVAVTRGLLLDLVAGADERDVTAAYALFVDLVERFADTAPAADTAPSDAAPAAESRVR
jgi:AcrR family transcriptional regulator